MNKIMAGEKHFVASVWILSSSTPKKILLIHHKKSGRWQQPGGHIESFENPIEAAVREVAEETGLNIDFLLKQVRIINHEETFLPVPKYIMEQAIPARGREPAHFHLDIQYVLEIPEQKLVHNKNETHDIAWFTKEEVLKLPLHADTKVVVAELI